MIRTWRSWTASGQLGPVVDAQQRAVVRRLERDHRPAVGQRKLDKPGQVELTGGRRRAQIADPVPEPGDIEGVQPGVDLGNRQFGGCRVLRLDDAFDVAAGTADDPPEPAGIDGVNRQDRDRGVLLGPQLEQLDQQVRVDERHVTVEHEEVGPFGGHGRQRGPHRVAGAARLVLQGKDGLVGERRANGGGRGRDDDDRLAARRGPCRVDDVSEHRPAQDRMQQLRRPRSHPRAEARGEDDRPGSMVG